MFWMIIGFGLLASAFTANKFLLRDLSPLFLVALRMTIPGIILIGYYLKKTVPESQVISPAQRR